VLAQRARLRTRGACAGAYLYSRSAEFAAALEKTRRTIRTFAASLGKANRYHETITVAYLALIRQRLFEHGDGGGWEGFSQANPELLDRHLLLRFYPQRQLESELARRIFLLPSSCAAACRSG
jgi:hypothetical protein